MLYKQTALEHQHLLVASSQPPALTESLPNEFHITEMGVTETPNVVIGEKLTLSPTEPPWAHTFIKAHHSPNVSVRASQLCFSSFNNLCSAFGRACLPPPHTHTMNEKGAHYFGVLPSKFGSHS